LYTFLGLFSSPFFVLSGVPQGSVLGPLLFNIFTNDLPEVINHSSCLLFADDLKVYRGIKSPNDCFLLQLDVERVQEWCSANLIKPNLSKTRVISFSRNTTVLIINTGLEILLYCELIVSRISECLLIQSSIFIDT
jgi:hypothetical protein